MRGTSRKIWIDLKSRRHVEVYVVTAASVAVAALSLVGDLVGDEIRWSVVLGALGLLTYQIALPDRDDGLDAVLLDRSAFEETPLASRLAGAREVWVYGPSAINLLGSGVADQLRSGVLSRPEGVVRVAVLDPAEHDAVEIARRQLDESLDYRTDHLPRAVEATIERLERMAGWTCAGTLEYRLVPFNPGFSLVAIDPGSRHGVLIVEFHALRNESTGRRMHVELTRPRSEYWYGYWQDQFECLWGLGRPPGVS